MAFSLDAKTSKARPAPQGRKAIPGCGSSLSNSFGASIPDAASSRAAGAMRMLPLAGKLVSIAALGFALRVAARSYSGEADFWANGYGFFFELAHNVAAGNGLAFDGGTPTAYRVPLYPLFLSAVTLGQQAFVSVLLWQSLIGAGTVLCTALIARELFGSGAAMIAATLSAIYPYYVVHDTALQETG